MTDIRQVSREAQAAKMLLDSVHQHFCDDEDAAITVVEGETSLLEVIDEVLVRITEIDAHCDGIDAAIAKLGARKNRLKVQAERLKASLLLALDTIEAKKLERPSATLSIAKIPDKAVITSEESIPSSFLVEKTEIKPDKKAILAALKAGEAVPGAELSNGGVTLRILGS
jgi:hypothetical protein